MKNKQYLTFRLHDMQYGIEAALVQEMFSLPELLPIAEATTNIMGLLNLRGQIVPIMHLDLLQGHSVKGCYISDHVIIVQWENLQIGMVVHQVNEVLELNDEIIKPKADYELLGNIDTAFITKVAQVDTGNVLLLEPKLVMGQLDAAFTLIWDAQMQLDGMATTPTRDIEEQLEQEVLQQSEELQASNSLSSFYDLYCPNFTLEEKAILRARADNLRQPIESIKVTNQLMPLAVIGFGDEYFGLDLDLVRGFTDIVNLTPIPCCPNHILGNMNLRGEIVTLVDIRKVLNLPTPPVKVGSQVVLVQVEDIVAGLPVERVLEMVDLNAADMTSLSGILSDFSDPYIRGTAFFQEKILRVLDLPKIFTGGGLVVNEEV